MAVRTLLGACSDISLRGCSLTHDELPILIPKIQENQVLAKLDLSQNVELVEVDALCDAVLQSPSLRTFSKINMHKVRNNNISEINLANKAIGTAGAIVLGSLMVTNKSLTNVNLSGCGLSSKCVTAISEGLGGCKTLQTLSLEENNIQSDGTEIIAQSLASAPKALNKVVMDHESPPGEAWEVKSVQSKARGNTFWHYVRLRR